MFSLFNTISAVRSIASVVRFGSSIPLLVITPPPGLLEVEVQREGARPYVNNRINDKLNLPSWLKY